MVEPDHPEVDKRHGKGEELRPLVYQRGSEFSIADFGSAELDDQEGDRDCKHGVAERLDPHARDPPALSGFSWTIHSRSNLTPGSPT
jgi:hypothetical protein